MRLAVRTPPNIIIRNPIGPLLARLIMRLPTLRADAILRAVSRREIGDLTEYGLPVPEEGLFSRLKRLGVAPTIVDHEVIESIKERRIEIVTGVESLDETGVTLSDGSRLEPDAVIAATGYRSGLAPTVGHLDVLDERGLPRGERAAARPALRGLRPAAGARRLHGEGGQARGEGDRPRPPRLPAPLSRSQRPAAPRPSDRARHPFDRGLVEAGAAEEVDEQRATARAEAGPGQLRAVEHVDRELECVTRSGSARSAG